MRVMAEGLWSFGAFARMVLEKEPPLGHVGGDVGVVVIAIVVVAVMMLLVECVCCACMLSFAAAFANRPQIELQECIICTVSYLQIS